MSHPRRRSFATSLLATSVLVILMSLGGGWGRVYGQSGGPTPTPIVGIVAPDTGAEGEGPGRNEAVAGESGEAGESARPEIVAGESGTATELPLSGAESSPQWTLFMAGMVLFIAGAFIFQRTRKSQL